MQTTAAPPRHCLEGPLEVGESREGRMADALLTVLALLPAGHTVPKCQGECSYCRIRMIITEALPR